jgi:hypothetical protein
MSITPTYEKSLAVNASTWIFGSRIGSGIKLR